MIPDRSARHLSKPSVIGLKSLYLVESALTAQVAVSETSSTPQHSMRLKCDDIYAYAAAALLAKGRGTGWPRVVRTAWLACLVLFTAVLQITVFALVFTTAAGSNQDSFSIQDLSLLLSRVSQLLKGQQGAGGDITRLVAAARQAVSAQEVSEEGYLQKLLGDPTSVAVAAAVVLLALSVHREMRRAAVMARVVMSHTGFMPPFFAPAYLSDVFHQRLAGLDHCIAPLLLLLPLLQLGPCILALFFATSAYAKGIAEYDVTGILLNSVALLFVLEVDNVVCSIVKEIDDWGIGSAGGECQYKEDLALTFDPAQPTTYSKGPKTVFAYIYTAVIGVGFLSVPVWVVVSLQLQPALYVFGKEPHVTITTAKAFTALYLILVALLFEAPLVPKIGCTAWRACYKIAMVATAALACVGLLIFAAVHSSEPGSQKPSAALQDFGGFCVVVPACVCWAILYAIWPPVAVAAERAKQRNAGKGVMQGFEPMTPCV